VVHVGRCHDVFGKDRQLTLAVVNRSLNAHRRFRGASRAVDEFAGDRARGASGFACASLSAHDAANRTGRRPHFAELPNQFLPAHVRIAAWTAMAGAA